MKNEPAKTALPRVLLLLCLPLWGCASTIDTPDEPDPFVGEYTAFHWVLADAKYLLERNDYEQAIMIAKVGDHYRINIEPGLDFYPDQDGTTLSAKGGKFGITVRWISLLANDEGIHIRDNTFTPGFTFWRDTGPARFGMADPRTGEDCTANWSYERRRIDATFNGPAVLGVITCKGKPFEDPHGRSIRPGTLLVTPIGKFMYFGKPAEDEDRIKRNAGWLSVMGNGEVLFNDDGTLTEAGRYQRKWLKTRPIDW